MWARMSFCRFWEHVKAARGSLNKCQADPPLFLSTRKYSKAEVAHLLLLPHRINGIGVKILSRSQVEQVMVPGAVDGITAYCALGERHLLMGTERISGHHFPSVQPGE